MILTDYYKFEKTALKAKLRMDCTASTKSYPEFETKRAATFTTATAKRDETAIGSLVVYYGDLSPNVKVEAHRKADKGLSIKGKHLSSVFVPDVESGLAYGDFYNTADALLFVFHGLNVIDGRIQAGGIIEVFVARGKSKDRIPLYNLLSDGELDEEIQALREQAQKE